MASTVYKGDISEVTFGKECGLALKHGGFGALQFETDATGTVITFSGANQGFFDGSSNLKYPVGMLVGSQLRVNGAGNFTDDDNATKGHVYTIVANSGDKITVSPAMKELSTTSTTGDELLIDTIGTPTIDVGMTFNAQAASSDESVLTDQFIGLAATVALPETKVEIRRSHIVGVGRDVVIQEPQRFSNEGGSLETMMNSARWLYYSLGREVIDVPSTTMTGDPTVGGKVDIAAGDTFIAYTGAISNLAVGEYIIVVDSTATDFPKDTPAAASKEWGADGLGIDMENTERNEIRQVLYIDPNLRRIHVDEPFYFNHDSGTYTFKRVKYMPGSADGSPNFDTTAASFGTITNRQSRLLFSGATLPSFAIESSIRTHNTGSFNASGEGLAEPGSVNDSKQLTRVWKGCKVKDFSLAADADAEVKLSVNFDALYCYTDTGRLEDTNKGDRYTAHRMFENTANSTVNRKKAGIAPNTEKPFFFYNGQISSFGINIAQVTNFALSGNNNAEAIYTIRGNSQTESRNNAGSSLEQIPFGGSRNANIMIEKAMEYELSMTVIASDPLIWHEFRTNRTHNFTEPITLTLTKAGAGANREEVIIVIDDYIIDSAPLPIPEDKGVIKSELTIKPKHVRVISHDAFLHM
tara:strand:- start:1007 stop:2923 length:1917 start_codon:yes stop_codon:yes gene_type:complete